MDWPGIPFGFVGTESLQHAYLNINHIPDIVVQTGFSWESLISGLIAGAIPAIVAVKAMKSNAKNIQDERRHQLELANKNITLQIVSASRQVWINDLRDAAASYMGAVTCSINSLNMVAQEVRMGKFHSENYLRHLNENLNAKRELGMLTSKIGLLLNPDEDESKRILTALDNIRKFLLLDRRMDEMIDFNDIDSLSLEFRKSIYAVVKKEWNKIKSED